jgi:ribosomal silencing factor RsfS
VIVRALDASRRAEGAEGVHCHRSSSSWTLIMVNDVAVSIFLKRESDLEKCNNFWKQTKKVAIKNM